MIDTHAHLHHRRYTQEEPAVEGDALVKRAGEGGVGQVVSIACEFDEWQPALKFAEAYPGVFVACALHPASVDDSKRLPTVEELLALAQHPKCVAFGETGLDAKPGETPSARQVESFKIHLRAAQQANLPVCLHTRGAEDLVLGIMREFPDVKFVYHCFTGTAAQAAAVLEQGGYISLSGIVTFGNARELQEVARTIPLDRLVLETDAPYLAPTPFRGKRNEPALVAETYKFVAGHLNVALPELTRQVATNFQALFRRATI